MTDIATPKAVVILDRVIDLVNRVLKIGLTAAFALILLVTLAQVSGRHGLTPTVTGADEIARYLMVATTFLAIPILVNERLNIAVDALAHYLPNGVTQTWLQRIIYVVETTFYAMFANYAGLVWSNYQTTGQASPELSLPLSWPLMTMIVGAALGAVVTLALFARTFLYPDDYRGTPDTEFAAADGGER